MRKCLCSLFIADIAVLVKQNVRLFGSELAKWSLVSAGGNAMPVACQLWRQTVREVISQTAVRGAFYLDLKLFNGAYQLQRLNFNC